jgi:hypothetical protein
MSERIPPHQLSTDAQRALRLATRLAGKQPIITRVPTIAGEARARLIRPLQAKRPYEIEFARGQERVLDHLVAHEVGHIERLHRVPEEERLFAVATAQNRRRAAEQIAPEILARLGRSVPDELLMGFFEIWYQGVCTQLASFPADLRIEQWVHDSYPGIRELQRRSLIQEVHRSFPGFAPEVIALTPPTIFRATMDGMPELVAPFEAHEFAAMGSYLSERVFGAADEGHRSDMAATNDWAQAVTLAGWITWQQPAASGSIGTEINTR